MKTNRGFEYEPFTDTYGNECSIQESSNATKPCVWLGIAHPKVRMLAADILAAGWSERVTYDDDGIWGTLHIPEEALIESRMHLDRKQAGALAKILTHFAKTGSLPDNCNYLS